MARLLGPDVVSDEGLRELLGQGHHVEVVCLEPAERRSGGVWYGLWGIRSVSPDGQSVRILVATPRARDRGLGRPRTFRTLNGIAGFLRGLGFPVLSIPFEAGGEAAHVLDPSGAHPA